MQLRKLIGVVAFLLPSLLLAQPTGPPISGGGSADPLTVLGPASVCADNQLARWNGASNTALQCSALTAGDAPNILSSIVYSSPSESLSLGLDISWIASGVSCEGGFPCNRGYFSIGPYRVGSAGVGETDYYDGLLFGSTTAGLSIQSDAFGAPQSRIYAEAEGSTLDVSSDYVGLWAGASGVEAQPTYAGLYGGGASVVLGDAEGVTTADVTADTTTLSGDLAVDGGDLTAPGALTISTAGSNGDITLDPHGTGSVIVPGYELILGSEASGIGFCGGAGSIGCSDSNVLKLIQKGSGYLSRIIVNAMSASSYNGGTTNGVIVDGDNASIIFGSTRAVLISPAAAVLEQRNGANAQTYRVYGTYTDASNYERLSLSTTAGTGATIAVETDGTGADNLDLMIKPAGTGQLYVGAGGVTAASPAGAVVNATGGSGTDIAGASLTIAGGKGTGDAAGGSVVIQTSDPGASGTTLQTLATRVTVGVERTTIANILSLTGIAAAPSSPAAGDIVYDSVNNLFCGYNGSAWVSFSGAGTCWAE